MADFFNDKEEEVVEAQEEVEKIKLGEKEFTQDELSKLVGLGEKYIDTEKRYNIKLDNVWPENSKLVNENRELKTKLSEFEKPQRPQLPEDQLAQREQAIKAAKELGIVTGEDFEGYMSKSFQQFYAKERMAERLLDECSDLEGSINGSDGRPKFETETILKHMNETGIQHPEKAYKDLYETQIDAWKERKLSEAKKPGYVTQEQGGGAKLPPNIKITRDNLDQMVAESLEGKI